MVEGFCSADSNVVILVDHCFSVSGPTVWNALPYYFRNPTFSTDVVTCVYRVQQLKMYF